MKSILFFLSFFMITPALADLSASYTCKSSASNKGILRIVDTRFSEPRVDFFPEGDSHTDNSRNRYQAYFSDLKTNESLKFPQYLNIQKVDHFGLMKIVSNVYLDPQVLNASENLRVVLTKKILSFRGHLLNLNIQSFNCSLN